MQKEVTSSGAELSATGLTAASPLGQFCWAFYEWGRTPYVLLINIYLFVPFYTSVFAGDEVQGQIALSWISSISGFAVALLAPCLGAVADLGGGRKPWIAGYSLLLAAGSFALWWAIPGGVGLGLFAIGAILVLNNVLFEFSAVFHNAMLPAICQEKRIAIVSGWGLAYGNLAGVLLFVFILYAFAFPGTGLFEGLVPAEPMFGIDRAAHEDSRLTGPLAAVWLVVFMLPFLIFTRDAPGAGLSVGRAMRRGPMRVLLTIRHVWRYQNVARFLLARMFYNDGKTAVLTFGGAYAAATFNWGVLDMTLYAIILSIFAVAGGFIGGWLDDTFGSQKAIMISIAGTSLGLTLSLLMSPLTILGIWTYTPETVPVLYEGLGFNTLPEVVYIAIVTLIAIFITAAYANSRTMLARIAPPEKMAEFFGLYAFSGQATSFLAPAAIGIFTAFTGSTAGGLASVLIFFVIGIVLMLFVRQERAVLAEPSV